MKWYLSQNRKLRLTTLCCLYVAQGIPYGFVVITFAAWLAKPEHGLTTEQIGPMLAVASLPWSFKFVWGPLMDRFSIPALGRRRPWIIFAQVMAIIVLGSMALFASPQTMVIQPDPESGWLQQLAVRFVPGPLAALILVANIFVSMQDVAVDALAVDLLEDDERSSANGLMYGCAYLGQAIGGAGLGFIVSHHGIRAGMLCQAALLGAIVLMPILLRERPPAEQAASVRNGDGGRRSSSVVRDLVRAFSLRSTIMGAVLALTNRIGVGLLTAVFVNDLIKSPDWTQEEYSTLMGGWALLCGLCGSIFGGVVADRVGARTIISLSCLTVGLLWVTFGLWPELTSCRVCVQTMLITQEGLSGMMAAAMFGLYMGISWPRVAATQFTAYMALLNLSMTIGSYLAGSVGEVLSVAEVLLLAGSLQCAAALPLTLIDPGQTRRELGAS